jgi:hypothetical protein
MSHKAKPRHLLLKTMGVTTQNYGTYDSKPWELRPRTMALTTRNLGGFTFLLWQDKKTVLNSWQQCLTSTGKSHFRLLDLHPRGKFICIPEEDSFTSPRKIHLHLDVILPHYKPPKIRPRYRNRHGIPSWHLYPGINNSHSRDVSTNTVSLSTSHQIVVGVLLMFYEGQMRFAHTYSTWAFSKGKLHSAYIHKATSKNSTF